MENSQNPSIPQLILRGWLIVNLPVVTIVLLFRFGLSLIFNTNPALMMLIGTIAGWYYWVYSIKHWVLWAVKKDCTHDKILLAGRIGLLLWSKQTINITLGKYKRKAYTPILATLAMFVLVFGALFLIYGSSDLYSKYYHSMGASKHKGSDKEGAIIDYTKALEYNPKNAITYTSRGSAYYDMNNFEQAYSDYTKALSIDSTNALIYAYRGQTSYQTKDYSRALLDYTKAIDLDNTLGLAYYYRGLIYKIAFYDTEKSCVDFRQALELGYPSAKYPFETGLCN